MRYVKICPDPNCRHENHEHARSCEGCKRLLGNVNPTPLDDTSPAPDDQSGVAPRPVRVPLSDPPPTATGPALAEDIASHARPISKTKGLGNDSLTLAFIRGGRVFTIRSGQTLGRDDGSNDPNRVDIPADAGVDVGYVSRWHCRFDYSDGHWSVTPLHPREFGSDLKTANPTFLGAQRLTIGQPHPLQHGDCLTLVDVVLRVQFN